MKNTLLFIYSTNILVRLLTVNMKNCMWLSWKCDPIHRHIPINLLKGSTFETTQLIFNFFVNCNWKKLTDSRKGAKILVDNLITVKEPLLSRAVALIRFSPSRPPPPVSYGTPFPGLPTPTPCLLFSFPGGIIKKSRPRTSKENQLVPNQMGLPVRDKWIFLPSSRASMVFTGGSQRG